MSKRVVAIACADIHLCHTPPIARSAEPNWYEAMKRPLHEIEDLQSQNGDCPILCAGEIFDKPNPPPELINFAMAFFPRPYDDVNHPQWFCVPGNHELPNHRLEDIRKSAYYTLVKAGRIVNLSSDSSTIVNGCQVVGFPWGIPIEKFKWMKMGTLTIAVCHAYIWQGKTFYPGAPEEKNVKVYREKLKGFDAAIFGDNHISFVNQGNKKFKPNIFNCGSIMRRHSDQRDYKPRVGLLMEDGTFQFHYLDCSKDKFLEPEEIKEEIKKLEGLEDLVHEFDELEHEIPDFINELDRALSQNADLYPHRVRRFVKACIERVRK